MSRKRGKNKAYELKPWEHDPTCSNKHYIRLTDSMLDSPAWLALPDSAKWQYMVVRKQYKNGVKQTDGNGNPMVKCPYSGIRNARISSNATISKNFKLLEELGFLKIISGGFHAPSQFKFADKWHNISYEEAEEIRNKVKHNENQKKQP